MKENDTTGKAYPNGRKPADGRSVPPHRPSAAKRTVSRNGSAKTAAGTERTVRTASAKAMPPVPRTAAQKKPQTGRPSGTAVRSGKGTVPKKRDTRFDTSADWKRAERTEHYAPPTFEGAPRAYSPKKDQTTPAERRAGRTMEDRLRAQTPARRREEKLFSHRVDVTELRRRNVRTEFRLKKEEGSRWKRILRCGVVVLVLYAIIMSVIAVFIGGNLIIAAAKNRDNVFIHISSKNDPRYVKRTQKYASVFRDGVMYVSMTDIAMLGDLATTGDAEELRYLTADGQYITFAVGGETAFVNGIRVRLDRATYKEKGMFYVPATFIERYVVGFSITYDDTQEKMTILRNQELNEYAEMDDAPVFFRLFPDEEQPPIPEEELDRLLKERNEG